MSRPVLRVFLDEGVPTSVGHTFKAHGHVVIHLRDAIDLGSSDQMVCIAADANDAILVANDGDMKQIAKDRGISNSRYRRLSLIKLSCNEVRAASRVEQFMSLIESEWQVADKKAARRLFVEIQDSRFITNR